MCTCVHVAPRRVPARISGSPGDGARLVEKLTNLNTMYTQSKEPNSDPALSVMPNIYIGPTKRVRPMPSKLAVHPLLAVELHELQVVGRPSPAGSSDPPVRPHGPASASPYAIPYGLAHGEQLLAHLFQ